MKTVADMHIHSCHSHDSDALLPDICETAIEKKIGVIAITDHLDIEFCKDKDVFSCIKDSHEDVKSLKNEYADKLEILAGVEICECVWFPDYARECLSALDYDVVIGSLHAAKYGEYTAPYSRMDFSQMPIDEVYGYIDRYLDEMVEFVSSFDFDVLAHLTCPLRYINGKYGRGVDMHRYAGKIDTVLRLVIEKNIALEVNTSGYGTSVGFMPDEWIVKRYVSLGGTRITVGSDAHIADNIGKGLDAAIEMLKKLGIDHIYSFKNRKPIRHDI